MKLIPTILCGGAGSRLWPVSREFHPKPFIRLAGGQNLLQKAWLRGARLPDVAELLTVTNRELVFKTEDDYREVAHAAPEGLANSFILEPYSRNTAPAIAAAALHVASVHGDDAVMEKSHNLAVVPCSIGWSDIGSWNAIGELVEPDGRGNRIQAQVQLHDVDNCYIQSDERLVGAVGINNLIIVDTLEVQSGEYLGEDDIVRFEDNHGRV